MSSEKLTGRVIPFFRDTDMRHPTIKAQLPPILRTSIGILGEKELFRFAIVLRSGIFGIDDKLALSS